MKKLLRYLICILWYGEHDWEYIGSAPTDRADYFCRCKRCGKRAMFWHPMHGVTWGENAILRGEADSKKPNEGKEAEV